MTRVPDTSALGFVVKGHEGHHEHKEHKENQHANTTPTKNTTSTNDAHPDQLQGLALGDAQLAKPAAGRCVAARRHSLVVVIQRTRIEIRHMPIGDR